MKEPRAKPPPFSPVKEDRHDQTAQVDNIDSIDELDELEFDDDRFLEEYRLKRMQELEEAHNSVARREAFKNITAKEFVNEVTEASENAWVVCHLYKENIDDCCIMNACLGDLSLQQRDITFVKIVSTDCIPGYPDENLPTILLYRNRKCVKTLVGLKMFGGQGTSPDTVAQILREYISVK